jgi:hypothetical protein
MLLVYRRGYCGSDIAGSLSQLRTLLRDMLVRLAISRIESWSRYASA